MPFLPRDEFPTVVAWPQSKLQNAEGSCVAQFAVRMSRAEGAMIFAAGADDKFANATGEVGFAIRSLRGEALVIMIVAVNDDIGVCVVKGLPERLEGKVVAVFAARAEKGFVKVGESTRSRMRGEIGTKPFFLARTSFTAADFGTLAV